jgi:hypothetical protein
MQPRNSLKCIETLVVLNDSFSSLCLSAISIIFGLVICFVHLGTACPRRPLWDVGEIPLKSVMYTFRFGFTLNHHSFLAAQDEEQDKCIEWVEGLAVLLACLIVGSITALNNYKKELQFRKLQQKQDDSHVTLWRNGEVLQAPVNEVCVGDVVQLDTGAKIPAGISHNACWS